MLDAHTLEAGSMLLASNSSKCVGVGGGDDVAAAVESDDDDEDDDHDHDRGRAAKRDESPKLFGVAAYMLDLKLGGVRCMMVSNCLSIDFANMQNIISLKF